MIFCLNNFVKQPSENDKFIQIYDCNNQLKYLLDPFITIFVQQHKYIYFISDNKIDYKNYLEFNNENESYKALIKLNDVKKYFLDRLNSNVIGLIDLVKKETFNAHTADTTLHLTSDLYIALKNSNNPSATNPFATINDIRVASGDTKEVKISILDDTAGFLSEKLEGSENIELEIINQNENEKLKIKSKDLVTQQEFDNFVSNTYSSSEVDQKLNNYYTKQESDNKYTTNNNFESHTSNNNIHIDNINIKQALNNANNPSSLNPFATFEDINIAASGLTIPTADARYVLKNGDSIVNGSIEILNTLKTNNLKLNNDVIVNEISNDEDFNESSNTKIVTQSAIKNYVDHKSHFSVDFYRNGIITADVDLLLNSINNNIYHFIIPYKSKLKEIIVNTSKPAQYKLKINGYDDIFENIYIIEHEINNEQYKIFEVNNSLTFHQNYYINIRIENINTEVNNINVKLIFNKIK